MKSISYISILLVFTFSIAQVGFANPNYENQKIQLNNNEPDCLEKPGVITPSSNKIYPGAVIEYSIEPLDGASYYVWTLPEGWEGTSTTNSISVTANKRRGNISVTAVSETCGASEASTLELRNSTAPNVEICLVTVDSASTHNMVVWEKPVTLTIDSFLIFRMFPDSMYYQVGAVHYDSLSIFHDYDQNADPNISAHRYKLATLDTGGVMSTLSDYHATMHLTVTNAGDMLWTWYQIENTSNPVSFFNCYRDDQGNGNFQSISTLAGTVQTWVDSDISLYPNARYVIDVDWNISCTATRENVNTTRSNLDQRINLIGIEENLANEVEIYPNPTNGPFYLKLNTKIQASEYILWSGLGALSYKAALPQNTGDQYVTVDLPSVTPGLYFVEVITKFGSITKKVVVR